MCACVADRQRERDALRRPHPDYSRAHDAHSPATSSTSGSVQSRIRRAPSGFARIRPSTPRSARGSARRSTPRLERGAAGQIGRRCARTRSHASCCSTSSRATPIATRRARSPAIATALATADRGRRCGSRSRLRSATNELSCTCRSSTPRIRRCSSDRSRSSRALPTIPAIARPARVGREARGDHPPLRPLSAPQRDPRPRVDARGDRVPAASRGRGSRRAVAATGPYPEARNPGAGATMLAAMTSVLGIFGGTFDPIHCAHLELAREVRAALDLAAVRFIPAGDPPHRAAPVASAMHRLRWSSSRSRDRPGLEVDSREIDRRGRSYTVATLAELRVEAPERPLGADRRRRRVSRPARPGIAGTSSSTSRTSSSSPDRASTLEGALPPPLAHPMGAALPRRCGGARRQDARGAIVVQPITAHAIAASAIRAQLARGSRGHRRGARFASRRRFGLY